MKAEYMPQRQTKRSCGYDIHAEKDIVLTKGVWQIVNTGVKFDGTERFMDTKKWFGLIVPRSSFGFKYKLRFANTVCIIDQDYRDDIMIQMVADEDLVIKKGERFAQMIFMPYLTLMDEVSPVAERVGGLGSTTRQVKFE